MPKFYTIIFCINTLNISFRQTLSNNSDNKCSKDNKSVNVSSNQGYPSVNQSCFRKSSEPRKE